MAEVAESQTPARAAEQNTKTTAEENIDEQNADATTVAEERPAGTPKPPKPSLMDRLGLDLPTILTMFKGSLPPIIAVAMYQAPVVNKFFSNLGYLIPMVSLLGMAILPRGKYIQNLVLNCLAIGLSGAVGLLAIWSSIQARKHTTSTSAPESTPPTYNASQSAVAGVWLFFGIWIANILRAKMPGLTIPVIIFSVVINISATTAPFLTTTDMAETMIREIVLCMYVGMGIATGVNMIVFPVSCRFVVFKQLQGVLMLARRTVALQKGYLNALESEDMFARETPGAPTKEAQAAKALAGVGAKLRELGGKLHADMKFAKREVAWGKLDAKEIKIIFGLVRNIYIPLLGITTVTDIFKRVAERRGWDTNENTSPEIIAEKDREKRVWNEVMKQMHQPFEILSQALDQGLLHAGLCLEIIPRPPTPKKVAEDDVEAKGEDIRPGDAGFSKTVASKVQTFYERKGALLQTWARERGLTTDEENSQGPGSESTADRRQRDQAQLYVVLYLEKLMHATGGAVLELDEYADKKVEDGTMSKNKLIGPTPSRLRKWVANVFSPDEGPADDTPETMDAATNVVYYGDSYNKYKDLEHLPPTTTWQRIGRRWSKLYGILGSEESAYGIRVSLANMTIGIVAFLEPTQNFFAQQRLVWSMIIIAIGMTMTSGQSILGFIGRVIGTTLAMIMSLVIWYIVDQKIPGVIVFLWISLLITYYFFIKYPRMVNVTIMVLITLLLILGYELQVVTIGPALASQNNQPYYPTYKLAPYRLASVAGGAFIGFIWTVFPSPLTDRTLLRRDVSATLYLIANYFSIINSSLTAILDGSAGDVKEPKSPAHRLFKARNKIFGRVQLLIPSMAQHSEWEKWEPTLGGRFPREVYRDIILRSTRIMDYLSLTSYTLTHPPRDVSKGTNGSDEVSRRQWVDALSKVLATIQPTHYTILSTLTLLSNSIVSGQSLPPFLPLPQPYELTRRLMHLGPTGSEEDKSERPGLYSGPAMLGLDRDDGPVASILDARNMGQPGYAGFAVMQVCSTLICDDLEGLVRAVSGLVGVVDFGFQVDRSDSTLLSSEAAEGKGKVD